MCRSSPWTSTAAPIAARPAAMPAIRSDSFLRSSLPPRTTVVPRAWVAARQSAGISSIAMATSAAPIWIDSRAAERTTRSPMGSPADASRSPWGGSGTSSMSAPIPRSRSMTARRVGFRPTPRSVSSASGWMEPATSQKAAAEMSPGTRSSTACTRDPPTRLQATPGANPSRSVRSTATPCARSIRSV